MAAALAGAFLSIELSWLGRSALAGPLVLLGVAVLLTAIGLAMTAVTRDK